MSEHDPPKDKIVNDQKRKWKAKLSVVTPLSKYLAMLLFVLMPFIGFWYGLTFWEDAPFENRSCPDRQTVLSAQVGDMPACKPLFPEAHPKKPSASILADWVEFAPYGNGYKFRHPSWVEIERDMQYGGYIIRDTLLRQVGYLSVTFLSDTVQINSARLSDGLFYEPFSDTYWNVGDESDTNNPVMNAAQCVPEPYSHTLQGVAGGSGGHPIFLSGKGRVGHHTLVYTIVLRTKESPLVVELAHGGSSSDSGFDAFQETLEMMAHTVQVKLPNCNVDHRECVLDKN